MEQYSIYENLESPLIARNIAKKRRKERILNVLSELGIEELKDKYPDQVSGGQRQRIAIARAMVTECPIVFADEPTGALDEENSVVVMELFKKLNEKGRTIIGITHDKKVAQYADRSIILQDGEIV